MRSSHAELEDASYSDDDSAIDFNSAALYLIALQTSLATVSCAAASIASCWLVPSTNMSAIRTLVITAITGFLLMRVPLRIGRARGVVVLFNALRPCVLLYVSSLVLEQLVHTCVARDTPAHVSRAIFGLSMVVLLAAGSARALKPTAQTDAPFLIASGALLIVAILPPPATPLAGPLCAPASLTGAGDRMLRSFLFSCLYTTHSFVAPPLVNAIPILAVAIARSASASVWVLGVHLWLTPLALVQIALTLYVRFGQTETPTRFGPACSPYKPLDTRSDGGSSITETELAIPPPPRLNTKFHLTSYTGDEEEAGLEIPLDKAALSRLVSNQSSARTLTHQELARYAQNL